MPLYKPSELRKFLSSIDKNPLRFSSQRFLVDGNVVNKILKEVRTRYVLEIGPGPGVLTEALLSAGHFVVAVEKDKDFARTLDRFSFSSLIVKEANILECSLQDIAKDHFQEQDITVISNLPYHLTTPILEWLFDSKHFFSKAVLMVQKEVAERLSTKKGGLMPLFLSYSGNMRQQFFVSKNSFWPKPRVDSEVIIFEPYQKISFQEDGLCAFFTMLRSIFSQKRKTLGHSLSHFLGKEKSIRVLGSLQILPSIRPEELFLEDFLAIFNKSL